MSADTLDQPPPAAILPSDLCGIRTDETRRFASARLPFYTACRVSRRPYPCRTYVLSWLLPIRQQADLPVA